MPFLHIPVHKVEDVNATPTVKSSSFVLTGLIPSHTPVTTEPKCLIFFSDFCVCVCVCVLGKTVSISVCIFICVRLWACLYICVYVCLCVCPYLLVKAGVCLHVRVHMRVYATKCKSLRAGM